MSEWTEQRNTVFLDRYAAKDKEGKPTEAEPYQMWNRVADAIGTTTSERDAFFELLKDFKFVPGGRILAGAGMGTEQTFYNCYVIPIEAQNGTGSDSREAIFDTIKTAVDILSRGGGVGINWSTLRPQGAYLKRVSGTSSGPVGWMDVASKAVGEVMQGGSRRGAAMFMLDDWHPDIERFINEKRNLNVITNANVSVAISDAFMAAVENDSEWELRFPDTNDPDYNSVWDGDIRQWEQSGRRTDVYRTVRARELWRGIAEAAWGNGEPGVVFLERYNKQSTGASVERIISVNPCGEQGLGAYSVCNLGSMNLDAYVAHTGKIIWFDYANFTRDVRTAIRFLDTAIDQNFNFLEATADAQRKYRRIGLGVMGLADALIHLGMRYGDESAVSFTEDIFKRMKDAAITESMNLAFEKGPAEAWDESMWETPFLSEFAEQYGEVKDTPLRNIFLLTQAPTGTTSILAGVNSGIEPYFAFSYTRKDRTGTHQVVADIVKGYEGAPLPDFCVTAADVTVDEHIAMQAAVQKYVDSSVSKTINAPNSHTVDDVERAFTLAYNSGLKGVAYFRDGCGRDQVLSTGESEVDKLKKELFKANGKLNTIRTLLGDGGSGFSPVPMSLALMEGSGCPSCGSEIVYEEGCKKCPSCGWAAC